MNKQVQIAVIATSALCIGALVYVFDRQLESVYFLSKSLSLSSPAVNLFGNVGNYLPTFIHVYAFILLTAACLNASQKQLIYICVTWLFIDLLFEVTQLEPVAQWIASGVANRFDGVLVLENITPYFLHGVFDISDIYSIAAGAVAAYLTIQYMIILDKGEST